MTEPPAPLPAPPPADEPPPRPPMRMFFALPPWFRTATEEERAAPEFEERLTAWFREQRLAREQKAKLENERPAGGPPVAPD